MAELPVRPWPEALKRESHRGLKHEVISAGEDLEQLLPLGADLAQLRGVTFQLAQSVVRG
jgi:hypothetical protein